MFRQLRDIIIQADDTHYWFAFSCKIDEVKERFFETLMPTSTAVNGETVSLPEGVKAFFNLGNEKEIPNLLGLTLYLIGYLSEEDLAELENESLPLRQVVGEILGKQYDEMLDGFFGLNLNH
jgi:hypothetical protein